MSRRQPILLLVLCLLLASAGTAYAAVSGLGVSQNTGSNYAQTPGGGTGGSFTYAEIRNSSHKIKWPSHASMNARYGEGEDNLIRYRGLSTELSKGGCGNQNSIYCPIWYNTKYTGASFPGWQEFHTMGPNTSKQSSTGVATAFNVKIWREPIDQNKNGTISEAEKDAAEEPIFERRVGINTTGNDTDTPGTSQSDWWKGIVNGGGVSAPRNNWYAAGAQGGPIADPDSQSTVACRGRWNNAKNPSSEDTLRRDGVTLKPTRYRDKTLDSDGCYWEGNDLTGSGRALRWNVDTSTGAASDGCSGSRCRYEALQLNVGIPASAGGAPQLSYTFAGRPSTFYAIQINTIDRNENLRTTGAPKVGCISSLFVSSDSKNDDTDYECSVSEDDGARYLGPGLSTYFRAWQPGGGQCIPDATQDENCNPPGPTTEPTEGVEPRVVPSLRTPGTAVTRQEIQQQIKTDVQYNPVVEERQAAFVKGVRFQHFTPQLAYNGSWTGTPVTGFSSQNVPPASAAGRVYGRNYVAYDSDPGSAYRVRLAASMGPRETQNDLGDKRNKTPAASDDQFMYMSAIAQGPARTESPDKTNNTYRNTWLRPTLGNPCSTGVGNTLLYGGWPTSSTTCPVSTTNDKRNAWDDVVNARIDYEARFATSSSGRPTYGVIHDQALRCDSEHRDGVARRAENCTKNGGTLANLPNSSNQYAQGYIYATTGGKRDVPVNVTLDTNHPELPGAPILTKRSDGSVVGAGSRNNTITNRPELWRCTQGPPQSRGGAAVHLNTGPTTDAESDNEVTESKAGDDLNGNGSQRVDCQGWVAKWTWATQDPYTYNTANPAANTCRLGNTAPTGLPTGAPGSAEYNYYLLNMSDLDPANHGGIGSYTNDNKIPYVGRKPGSRYGNTQDCTMVLQGNYTNASWKYAYDWQQAGNNTTRCKWRGKAAADNALATAAADFRNDVGASATIEAPGPSQRCTSTYTDSDGDTHYYWRLGWWERKVVDGDAVNWDTTTCDYRTTTIAQTKITQPGTTAGTSESKPLGHSEEAGLGVSSFLADGGGSNPATYLKTRVPLRGCTYTEDGKIYDGSWSIVDTYNGQNFEVGRGWGENHNGGRVDPGGYLATVDFDGVSNSTLASGVDWNLKASYPGRTDWTWMTNWHVNDPEQLNRTIQVYAGRAVR